MLNQNQKKLLRYYYGLEKEKRLTIKEISKKENKSYATIYQLIRGSEKRIIKLIKTGKINEEKKSKKEKKTKKINQILEEFLKQNDIKQEDFDKAYNMLNRNQKKLLRYCFGLEKEKRLTIKEILKKENKSYTAIYHSIRGAEKRIITLIKTGKINEKKKPKKEKKNKKTQETLEEFLKKNDIEREDFDKALKLLSDFQRECLELYFGLNDDGIVMTYDEIAKKLKKRRSNVVTTVYNAKKNVVKLIKTEKVKEIDVNSEFKKVSDKLNYIYKKLLNDDNFRKLVSITSPVGATALSLINNFNFTLDELSVALFMDKESVIKLLLAVSMFAVSYIENPIHNESIDYGDFDLLDKTQSNAKKKGNDHNG